MPRPLALPRSLVGVALSLLAVLFGVLTGILVKKLSTDVTLVTTIFYRFLFSLPIIFIVALVMRGRDWLHIRQRKTMCLRVFFGFCGIMFWFLSVRNMPFGLATSLFQSSVIFITLMSPFLLNEKVGIYRWSAVIAGLSGVVIITNPFSGAMTLAAFFGVGAALSSAVSAFPPNSAPDSRMTRFILPAGICGSALRRTLAPNEWANACIGLSGASW